MDYGFLRGACASPALSVADCDGNVQIMADLVRKAQKQHVQLLVFPELSITGYTCGDLFLQKTLYDGAIRALERLCTLTRHTDVLFCVGLPVIAKDQRYNAAAFIQKGKVLALVAKTYIPTYSEFYERRWFTPADRSLMPQTVIINANPKKQRLYLAQNSINYRYSSTKNGNSSPGLLSHNYATIKTVANIADYHHITQTRRVTIT